MPQLIPDKLLTTVPLPLLLTARVKLCGAKVAVAEMLLVIVSTQFPVPLQPSLQPVKTEPVAGVAVSVTAVPLT
jgi:hypothetical protein